MENYKYDDLIKRLAELLEEKYLIIDTLSDEISRLNKKIENLLNTTKEENNE